MEATSTPAAYTNGGVIFKIRVYTHTHI